MNAYFTQLTFTTLLLVALPAQAITISLNPTSPITTVSSSFDVALVISGLGSGTAPSLGAFDLDVGYDSVVLGFSNVVFGNQLDLFSLGSLTFFSSGAGSVNLYQLSLDDLNDLNTLQADSFTLATLSFNALSAGVSPLSISLNAISDADGNALAIDSIVGDSVTVNANPNTGSVPEPAAWMLLGLGALIMNRFIRRPFKINYQDLL